MNYENSTNDVKAKLSRVLSKAFFILALSITITLLCGIVVFADQPVVKINSEAPAVGEPLTAELSYTDGDKSVEMPEGQYYFAWTVAGTDTGVIGNNYTPNASDYESWIEATAYDLDGTEIASDRIFFSPLPVVYINTDNSKEVISRDYYSDAHMTVQGNNTYDLQYDGKIEIKGRGTSSWHYDKKPYKIKLDKKTGLFGFEKNKHYVLLANYLDPSLLRNDEAFELANYLDLTTMDTTWVDLVFNGEYVGNYQLCEHIRVGKGRVDIFDWEDYSENAADAIAEAENMSKSVKSDLEEFMSQNLSWITSGTVSFENQEYKVSDYFETISNISGGYLFELGSDYKDEVSNFSTKEGIGVAVLKPEYINSNDEMFTYVKEYFQRVEDAISSRDGYNSYGEHYTQLIDMDSIVSYWLVMEILSNEDAAGRSRYCYLDTDGKLTFGPVWDFDISSGSFRSFFGMTGWNVTGNVSGWYTGQDFWKDFVDDPYFQIKAMEKYWQMRPYLEEMIKDGGYIDRDKNHLYESAVANEMRWTNDGYMIRSFTGKNGDAEIYKNFLRSRIEWLDMVFATEMSVTREMRNYLSNNPYTQSKKIKLSFSNEDSKLYACVQPNSLSNNSMFNIYINGICYGSCSVSELKQGITIDLQAFTEPIGSKNVIVLQSLKGEEVIERYITICMEDKTNSKYKIDFDNCDVDDDLYIGGSILSVCDDGHIMQKVEEREASNSQYGLISCWYCTECQKYFADSEGNVLLNPDVVIVSPATSDSPGGMAELKMPLYRINEKIRSNVSGSFGQNIASIYEKVNKRTVWKVSREVQWDFQKFLRKNEKLAVMLRSDEFNEIIDRIDDLFNF